MHSAPNCFFQLQGILHLWVFMVCLHSAPVRVPSRVPSPQSPLVGTHTLHCHSPQSDFFTFFSGFSFFPASAVSTAAKMKMNAKKAAANFRRCCWYCWDNIFWLADVLPAFVAQCGRGFCSGLQVLLAAAPAWACALPPSGWMTQCFLSSSLSTLDFSYALGLPWRDFWTGRRGT